MGLQSLRRHSITTDRADLNLPFLATSPIGRFIAKSSH